MFALYIFGRVLEDRWGSKPFLLFYLLAGVGAAATQILAWLASLYAFASAHGASLSHLLAVDPSISFLSAIGASGSIFAILFAFALTFPNAPLYIMFIPIPLKAKYVVAVYILIELVAAFAHIQGDLIAHFAHLGGILFAFLLLRLPPWKP
jgi:membrane associated rhomboid family serine protease